MTLTIDNRPNLVGKPGVHALIVGVSAYTYLPKEGEEGAPEAMGLRQLSSTAISACNVYHWLKTNEQNLPLPLATCRLLLSPSEIEIKTKPEIQGLAEPATLNAFLLAAKEWRQDAASSPENITFFYFAGHGAQRTKDDGVLLLEDFGDGVGGPLKNAVDINNIFKGMASSMQYPNMAQTQLYFVDACRDFLTAFRGFEPDDTTQVFKVQLTGEDHRSAPIFFAAVPGTKAYALSGQETLFSKALIRCLENDAGDFREIDGTDKWCVSVHTLSEALDQAMVEINQAEKTSQDVVVSGFVKETIINYLQKTPTVAVALELEPRDALQLARLEVFDDAGQPGPAVPFPLNPYPYRCTWPAGIYRIDVMISPPDPRFVDRPGRPKMVLPPRYPKKVRVTP